MCSNPFLPVFQSAFFAGLRQSLGIGLTDARKLMLARRIKEIRWKMQELNNRIENIYNKRLKVLNEHVASLETILELAAGPGDTGFAAAALLGDEGRLISTDFSPEMVEVARRRGSELGRGNVEFRVQDAERLELDDDSVDGVVCRWGFMLMPDPAAALAETRRVLRPGGRLVLAVWRGPELNPWVSLAGRVLAERGHVPPPDPEAPSMFGLASDERVRSLLDAAGFTDVRIEDVPVRLVWSDIDDYVVVGSKSGEPDDPAWFTNLRTNPLVTVEADGQKFQARATVAEGADRDTLWDRHVAEHPQFAEYPAKTDRIIPIARLKQLS
jgi:deazaflavin-dependent oxidoreductase (nitroreductase family)